MNTLRNILFIGLFGIVSLGLSLNVSAQELADIEIITINTQTVGTTPYGIVVRYVKSNLTADYLYIPNQWFKPHKPSSEDTPNVRAFRKFERLSLERSPKMKVKYANGKLSSVIFIMPREYETRGVPRYTGNLSEDELKAKFDEQASATVLLMEQN